MNKRQIKKRVKQAKLKKECGLVLNPEDRHYIRNYWRMQNDIQGNRIKRSAADHW